MPIYEFECGKCKKHSEILVRGSAPKGLACPHCGSKRLTKNFSTFASCGAAKRGGGGKSCSKSCKRKCACC